MGPDGVVSAATETFVSTLADRVVDGVAAWHKERKDKKKGEVTVDQRAIAEHLRHIVPWSERVTPLASPAGKATETSTVGMFIDVPRKYGRRDGKRSDESTLLTSPENLVILGDPGAGKTTTVKRLVRHLISFEGLDDDVAAFPVVIRCAELGTNRLLQEALADVFGIAHRRHAIDLRETDGRVGDTSLSEFALIEVATLGPPFVIPNQRNLPIERQLADTLDASGALVLIDGLDETPQLIREETDRAIATLARLARNTRFRITCRPGYYVPIEGFDAVQICPLTGEQIVDIARKWCSDPDRFLASLSDLPYADFATLPLFLLQLIGIFESAGFESLQTTSVYRVVIQTALEEWDRHKGVERRSRYAAFDADRKFKFLCHLAFHLMYTLQKTQFSTDDLSRVYRMICGPFDLPPHEELQVARELESHTGIFVSSGIDRYEFAHLSMQEYLCAEYLLAVPMDVYAPKVAHNLESVAVAAALTSNPAQWFSTLMLRDDVWPFIPQNTGPFFARLLLASDKFVPMNLLGYAALRFIFRAMHDHLTLDQYTERFLSLPAVEESIASALQHYDALFDGIEYVLTTYQPESLPGLHVPRGGKMEKERVNRIKGRFKINFKSYKREY